MNYYESVLEVLKKDDRFFTKNGEFLRNAVYEATMKTDASLLNLLYDNTRENRAHFCARPPCTLRERKELSLRENKENPHSVYEKWSMLVIRRDSEQDIPHTSYRLRQLSSLCLLR